MGDWGNDDNRSNRRPAATEFYQGMCGNDVDDDNNWVDNFCVDMFANSSPRTNLNICNGPNTNQINDFCDWLDVNNKSFSNRDYFLGMCEDLTDKIGIFAEISITSSVAETETSS